MKNTKQTPTGRNANMIVHHFDPAKKGNRRCRCGLVQENPIHWVEAAEASAWAYDDPDFIRS